MYPKAITIKWNNCANLALQEFLMSKTQLWASPNQVGSLPRRLRAAGAVGTLLWSAAASPRAAALGAHPACSDLRVLPLKPPHFHLTWNPPAALRPNIPFPNSLSQTSGNSHIFFVISSIFRIIYHSIHILQITLIRLSAPLLEILRKTLLSASWVISKILVSFLLVFGTYFTTD